MLSRSTPRAKSSRYQASRSAPPARLPGAAGLMERLEERRLMALAHPYAIVDTGQATCYDNMSSITAPANGQSFYGQDAQYVGHQASYTRSADGVTVYDNNTGLTWQHTPDTNGDGNITAADKFTCPNAQSRPAALNAMNYGGYSDWRLPTIKELYSLFDCRGVDPSGSTSADTSGLTPFINRTYFDFAYGDTSAGERVIDSQYMSSTLYVGSSNQVFGVNFADGRIKGYPYSTTGTGPDKTFLIQCVRGNTSYGINDFASNGDGTITDNATGLMWAQADSGSGMNWQQALAWAQTCNSQNYLGHNDWRLPNSKELQSIVDYTRSPGTTSSAAINALFNCTQITNEKGETDYPWYWTNTSHPMSTGKAEDADYVTFGRAWGYMNNAWVDIHGAGCQRGDPKGASLSSFTYTNYGYYNSRAPQGDAIRVNNYIRLLRDAQVTNSAPTDIALSTAVVAENQPSGTTVGTFSTTDPDTGNSFTYSLVGGAGSTDNASFTISGSLLKTGVVFDYETKTSYSIRVRSMDQGGRYTEKTFTITVSDVDEVAPTLQTAVSRKAHGISGNFDLPLSLTNATVEPRQGGPATLVLTFSKSVIPSDGTLSGNEFLLSGGIFSSASISGNSITLNLSGLTDRSVLSVKVQGLTSASGVAMTGDTDVSIRALYGDVNQSGTVSTSDLQAVKNQLLKLVSATNYLCDLNLSGAVATSDLQIVNDNLLHTVANPVSLLSSNVLLTPLARNPLLA